MFGGKLFFAISIGENFWSVSFSFGVEQRYKHGNWFSGKRMFSKNSGENANSLSLISSSMGAINGEEGHSTSQAKSSLS